MGWWSLASAAVSIGGNMIGAKAARKAADQNAEHAWIQTLEDIRRLDRQQDYTEGQSKAMLAGSGVAMRGTPDQVLGDMTREHKRQRDWMVYAGKMRKKEIKKGGQAIWYSNAIQGVSTGLKAWGEFRQSSDYANTFGGDDNGGEE